MYFNFFEISVDWTVIQLVVCLLTHSCACLGLCSSSSFDFESKDVRSLKIIAFPKLGWSLAHADKCFQGFAVYLALQFH